MTTVDKEVYCQISSRNMNLKNFKTFSGYPPRQAYIHGSIYNHESDDEHSSSEEDESEEHYEEDHKIWRFQISDDFDAYAYM